MEKILIFFKLAVIVALLTFFLNPVVEKVISLISSI
jgi:hypothetical protein